MVFEFELFQECRVNVRLPINLDEEQKKKREGRRGKEREGMVRNAREAEEEKDEQKYITGNRQGRAEEWRKSETGDVREERGR